MSCRIDFTWDDEAAVWIATSKDVPGLVLESGSFDALIERVHHAVSELLQLNSGKKNIINLTFVSERRDQITENIC